MMKIFKYSSRAQIWNVKHELKELYTTRNTPGKSRLQEENRKEIMSKRLKTLTAIVHAMSPGFSRQSKQAQNSIMAPMYQGIPPKKNPLINLPQSN